MQALAGSLPVRARPTTAHVSSFRPGCFSPSPPRCAARPPAAHSSRALNSRASRASYSHTGARRAPSSPPMHTPYLYAPLAAAMAPALHSIHTIHLPRVVANSSSGGRRAPGRRMRILTKAIWLSLASLSTIIEPLMHGRMVGSWLCAAALSSPLQ